MALSLVAGALTMTGKCLVIDNLPYSQQVKLNHLYICLFSLAYWIVGPVGTSLAFLDGGISVFWILASDQTYTILLPQLIFILLTKVSDGYGAMAGHLVAVVMSLLIVGPPFTLNFQFHHQQMVPECWIFKMVATSLCAIA